jgi:hypothetical protein
MGGVKVPSVSRPFAALAAVSLEHFSVRGIRLTVKKCGTAETRADSTHLEAALAGPGRIAGAGTAGIDPGRP